MCKCKHQCISMGCHWCWVGVFFYVVYFNFWCIFCSPSSTSMPGLSLHSFFLSALYLDLVNFYLWMIEPSSICIFMHRMVLTIHDKLFLILYTFRVVSTLDQNVRFIIHLPIQAIWATTAWNCRWRVFWHEECFDMKTLSFALAISTNMFVWIARRHLQWINLVRQVKQWAIGKSFRMFSQSWELNNMAVNS